jgi:hypothetical protein
MRKSSRFLITTEQQEAFVAFITKKVAFDRLALQHATTKAEKNLIGGVLHEALFSYQALERHPQSISPAVAQAIGEYLMKATNVYSHFIWVGKRGGINTDELEMEVKQATALYDIINGFLIELIEN